MNSVLTILPKTYLLFNHPDKLHHLISDHKLSFYCMLGNRNTNLYMTVTSRRNTVHRKADMLTHKLEHRPREKI